MVLWPGDSPPQIDRGDSVNLSRIYVGAHTGTHMDAPPHYIENGKGIDSVPLGVSVGQARIIEIYDTESINPKELSRCYIRYGERILLKTPNSTRCWKTDTFVEDFDFISIV